MSNQTSSMQNKIASIGQLSLEMARLSLYSFQTTFSRTTTTDYIITSGVQAKEVSQVILENTQHIRFHAKPDVHGEGRIRLATTQSNVSS